MTTSALFINHVPSPLTSDEVASYLERIQYPSFVKGNPFPLPTMETLKSIMLHHQLSVPFENLSLHYDPEHYIYTTKEWLYNRIVVQRKGSYCMGVNAIFLWLLRSLGFRAYSAGARVALPNGSVTGLSHMCLIVSLADQQTLMGQFYHVDVGFGPGNPTQPLPLQSGFMVPGDNPQLESFRLLNAPQPQSSQNLATNQDWHLQHRSSPAAEWRTKYIFMTAEFQPEDFELMAHGVNTLPGPRALFQKNVFMCKLFRALQTGPQVGEDVFGRWTLFGKELKQTIAGTDPFVKELQSEEDRIEAIKEVFGITVTDDEAVCIVGREAALPRRHAH